MKELKLLVIVLLVSLTGCSGIKLDSGRRSENYTNAAGQTWVSSENSGAAGLSFFNKDKSLSRMLLTEANAYAIKKDADTRELAIKMLKERQSAISQTENDKAKAPGVLVMSVVNYDPENGFYYYHPEISSEKCYVKPGGGSAFSIVSRLPKELTLYSLEGRYETFPIYKVENVHLNGIRVDSQLNVRRAPR